MKIIFSIVYLLTNLVVVVVAQTPLSSKVEMYKGRPTIMLNGKPEYASIYSLTDVPGGRWSWEELPSHTMKSFCSRGFRLVQVDLFLDHVWKEDGTILLDTAQRQLRGVLNNCPDAAIMIRFHVNPPKWWQKKFPEENTVYADVKPMKDSHGLHRIIEDDEENPTRFSLASKKWIDDASAKTKEFLQKLQATPEGNAVFAIQVASGVYGEWHYWGFINNEPDISTLMVNYFRDWLRLKYKTDAALQKAWNNSIVTIASASIPSIVEKQKTNAGVFRDPSKERNVIDYYEAQQTCVADDIIHFCKLVKETWKRPIITGAFYGYFYAVFGREAAGGHLELQRVLSSPHVDFLCGPGTYYPEAVNTGDAYRSRSLINSVTLHGKLWLDEMDQQTPLVTLKDALFNESVAKSIAQVRRNMLFTYTKAAGLWFYDFGPSGFNGGKRLADHGSWGWWDEPSVMNDIGKMKKLLDQKIEEPYSNDADVLLVHDTKSFYYTASSKPDNYMNHWTNNWIPPAIFKSGAVHDVVHVDDLDKVEADRYKVIVFVNTWVLNDSQKKLIRTKLASGDRDLVFVYAAGYSNEQKLDKKFIESVTGFGLRTMVVKRPLTMEVNRNELQSFKSNTISNRIDPLFVVEDKLAETLGTLKDTTAVLFARKALPKYTSWFMAIPSNDPALWRYVFQQGGAHIYETNGDVIYTGGGVLSIHTLSGGSRKIVLKNGRVIEVTLAPNSTTLFDPWNGSLLLE